MNTQSEASIRRMARAYLVAAFFTADDELVPKGPGEFQPRPWLKRASESMKDEALAVCRDFAAAHQEELGRIDRRDAGECLWFSRNGDGTGFFDCESVREEHRETLQNAALALGPRRIIATAEAEYDFDLG